ncbi:MAG: Asp-tRNA(Asn)/Glu-tRNA(Gln) amidotransferase subunit GatC [Planctomycetota bacterium]
MSEHITPDDVRKVAKLSRLKLSDEQVTHFTSQLEAVLGYVDKLKSLDVDGVEPMPHALDQTDVLREDVVGPALTHDDALKNAPSVEEEKFFGVPKVIGDGGGA